MKKSRYAQEMYRRYIIGNALHIAAIIIGVAAFCAFLGLVGTSDYFMEVAEQDTWNTADYLFRGAISVIVMALSLKLSDLGIRIRGYYR